MTDYELLRHEYIHNQQRRETTMNCKECGKELTEVGEMDEYQLCHPCYCTVMDTTNNEGKQQ